MAVSWFQVPPPPFQEQKKINNGKHIKGETHNKKGIIRSMDEIGIWMVRLEKKYLFSVKFT